jgi:hypothetical protein
LKRGGRLEFLSENVCGIALARDVRDGNFMKMLSLTNSILPDVEMPHTFSAKRQGPIHSTTVIIEHRNGSSRAQVQIKENISEHLSVLNTLIGSFDLCFT